MGIRAFFHKIKMGFVRAGESSIPYVSEAKRYGNYGEDEFTYMLRRELPSCKIKRNVVISTSEGNAEIDCLVFYQNKLFAIEVKRWKGRLTERENGFLQEKTDRWTGETHTKYLKSPFKQLGRAIYLLRKQIPIKAWINAVVFFEDDELESISTCSDTIWFDRCQDLVSYIRNEGKTSFGTSANDFFSNVFPPTTYTPMLGGNPCIASLIAPCSNSKHRKVLFRLTILSQFASATTGLMTNCIFK